MQTILSNPNTSSPWHADSKVAFALGLLGALSSLIILIILGFLWKEAWPVLSSGGWQNFFFDKGWYPVEGQFGILPMVLATLAATLGAIAIAAPLGVACAIFQEYYAKLWVGRCFRALMALLAGIPSVVYGLWGLTVLVPIIAMWQPPGASLLAAMIILAIMILPTVALTSASALSAIPKTWLHGADALGLSKMGKILGVAVPGARSGIISGVLLAVARAMGETMAVLMVAGNVVQIPGSLFDSIRVLTANIALEMGYAVDNHRAGLFASGLLLTLLVLGLAWLASRFEHKSYG